MPLASDSPWVKSPNLLYGSYGWQYVDNGEEYSKSLIKNDTIWNVGLRRYSGRSWQTDLKYSRAQHDVAYADGSGKQSIDFRTYTLTISYNIDVTKSLRLFAGAGVGYGKAEGPYNSDTSIFLRSRSAVPGPLQTTSGSPGRWIRTSRATKACLPTATANMY